MNPTLIAAGVLFLLKIATGIWLLRSGRPINSVILTLHKLIALGTVAALGLFVAPHLQSAAMSTEASGLVIATGAAFLLAIVFGGLASTEKLSTRLVIWIHRILTGLVLWLTILMVAMIL